MINEKLSSVFERIADLLEIDGADGFRVNSYRRAARTIGDCTEDVGDLAAEGKLTSLPGIGKGTAQRIEQFLADGTIDVLTELESKLPEGLPALLEIQGLGPKKVAAMHSELGVASLDDLRRVVESGELASLAGFGATSVKRIKEGIEFLETSGERTPIGVAEPIANLIAERVRGLPGVKQVEVAGSLRRGEETIGDVDILCEAAKGEDIIRSFTEFEDARRVLASGKTKGSITVDIGRGKELQVDLRVVPEESFGAAMQYFTGSKEHNVRLREIAVKKKLRLSEYGLFDGEKSIAGRKEEDIYKKLGVNWVPPELRQDRGELDADADLDDLVGLSDIRGDLHMHTVASDGRNTIEEMALAAKELGYKYIAITDHSRSSTIANGLTLERMWQQIEDVRAADDKVKGIRILAGTECDILPDGSLDYPDELLAECDCVVASIHSAMGRGGKGKLSPTERTIKAIENPYVSIIGHPTGRMLGVRPPMEMDMAAIVQAAAANSTILEINASWQRLDLKDLHVRMALEAGGDAGDQHGHAQHAGVREHALGCADGAARGRKEGRRGQLPARRRPHEAACRQTPLARFSHLSFRRERQHLLRSVSQQVTDHLI